MTRTLALLTLFYAACACSDESREAENTPEQAFEMLCSAVRDSRWELLYDVVPPDYQAEFDRLIDESDAQVTTHAEEAGEAAADDVLLQDFGITFARWKAMTNRERLATVYFVQGRTELAALGLNPDHLAASEVRSSDVRGDVAKLLIDDGKGHRTSLTFQRIGDRWYFDPKALE